MQGEPGCRGDVVLDTMSDQVIKVAKEATNGRGAYAAIDAAGGTMTGLLAACTRERGSSPVPAASGALQEWNMMTQTPCRHCQTALCLHWGTVGGRRKGRSGKDEGEGPEFVQRPTQPRVHGVQITMIFNVFPIVSATWP